MERLVLRGSKARNLLSLLQYPKCVRFASLTLSAKYWGPRLWAPLNKGLITSRKVLH
jgi:hypothetical protein